MLKIVNPATKQLIAELPEDTADAVKAKVLAARAAQPAWWRAPFELRQSAIAKWKTLVAENTERLARTLTAEMGKPLQQAVNELNALAGRVDFFLANARSVLEDELVQVSSGAGGTEERVTWEPLGVVANISAWNYPYFVGSNVFVPALLTGNAVVYKPSELTTQTGLALAELLYQAGVPPDVFQVVVGGGAVGAALLAQPIDGVFFTGSYGTGKRIAEATAGRMIKVQLELGGKDPAYVCDDVDIEAAAASLADGAMYNAGQSCCSVERVYVHEKIARPFIDAFVKTVREFVVGDPLELATYIGPLAREQQLAVLGEQVADARAKGAKVLLGGQADPARKGWFQPTVLSDVTSAMAVMRDESFGPIIGIQVVASDDEAVRSMNDTEYGLTAGVYTKSRERAERVLSQVNAGSAYWNCCDRVSPALPWTGRKHSGIGSTLSTHGIRAFVQPKAWHLRTPR
ncbi:MAG TPA: aldehyde dehydrogenase family protein [Polyangiaceae bacterium]|nr:aldehyde dehydrogenase family protein [Polyangiaceae bacterium]